MLRRRLRFPVSLLVVLVVVGSSELAIRAATDRLREPLLWPNWEVQNKIEKMDELADRGGASVVFIGSSMVNAGADPGLITQMLNLRRPAFNAAINGSHTRSNDLWARELVVPRLRPKVVVVGFNSEGFNDHGLQQESFYQKLISSPLGGALGQGDFLDRMEGWLTARSYLVRYRFLLRRPRDAVIGEAGGKAAASVDRLGVLAAMTRFHERAYQPLPDRQAWDRVFLDYTPGGKQVAALDHLVRDLTARGIKVVIVRMPVTADATSLHPHGRTDQENFSRMLEGFVSSHPVTYFDAESSIGKSTSLFVDPFHLNTEGSRLFSTELAQILEKLAA